MEWLESLNTLQRVFFYMAAPATVILVIQTILLLVGMGHGSDADVTGGEFSDDVLGAQDVHDSTGHDSPDVHGEPLDAGLRIFTVRGLVAFFTICGWSGMAMAAGGMDAALTWVFAVLFGALALVGVAYILKLSLKLQHSGNINLANAVGKVAQVYIPIPPRSSGTGKVMVEAQGRLIEASALTKQAARLATGANVKVTGIINETLIVEAFELE